MQKRASIFIVFFISVSSFLFAQDTLVFNLKYLPAQNRTLVFIPNQTAIPPNGFPLLYLLHGWSGSSFDWNNHVKIQDYADKYGFVIVCPDGYYDSWYVDSPVKENNQYRLFFNTDLVQAVHKKYKIDSAKVFISGLSMGGEGAINIFIANQNYFASAGSMSGIMDITEFPKKWGIAGQLGEYSENKEIWENYSCVHNLLYIKDKKKPFIVDCGTEDFAFPVNLKLKKTADSLGLNLTFKTRPGKHEWSYWIESLALHLEFFSSLMK